MAGARWHRPRLDAVTFRAEPAAWQLGHRPALDGLRGIAVLLVIAGHMSLPGVDSGGWAGVTLFFVLSGFLITSLLLEEYATGGRIRLRAFYIRRARRLLPALAVFLVVVGGALALIGSPHLGQELAAITFYAGNWYYLATGDPMDPFIHTWSLSVEEQFYIVWPTILIALLMLKRPAAMLGVVLVVATGSMLWRLYAFDGSDWSLAWDYHGSLTRADALLLGVALAIWFHYRGPWNPPKWLAYASVLTIAASAAPTGHNGQAATQTAQLLVGLSTNAVAGVVLVAYAATVGGRVLQWGWLQTTGRLSYALYLWHNPTIIFAVAVAYALLPTFAGSWVLGAFAGFGLAILAASLSYRFVEMPLRRPHGTDPTVSARPLRAIASAAVVGPGQEASGSR